MHTSQGFLEERCPRTADNLHLEHMERKMAWSKPQHNFEGNAEHLDIDKN